MTGDVQLGVKFVGYSAIIVKKENDAEADCAKLDFVTGSALLVVDDGFACVSSRADLGPFARSLTERAATLQERVNSQLSSKNETHHTLDILTLGSLHVRPRTDLKVFIRHLTERVRELEKIIDEAWRVGSRIVRRPYEDFIDEIRQTGISRVEFYGSGPFIGGRLIFHPSRQTLLMRGPKRVGGGAIFEIEPQKSSSADFSRRHN